MGAPDAVAVGRRGNGTVILSHELLAILTGNEVKAALARELAHLKHRGGILLTVAETMCLAKLNFLT